MTQLTDDLFVALADRRRRMVLTVLMEHDPERDVSVPDDIEPLGTDQDRMELHHVHLPKLDQLGFIDWDREAGTVTRGDRFEDVESYLRSIYECRGELRSGWL